MLRDAAGLEGEWQTLLPRINRPKSRCREPLVTNCPLNEFVVPGFRLANRHRPNEKCRDTVAFGTILFVFGAASPLNVSWGCPWSLGRPFGSVGPTTSSRRRCVLLLCPELLRRNKIYCHLLPSVAEVVQTASADLGLSTCRAWRLPLRWHCAGAIVWWA